MGLRYNPFTGSFDLTRSPGSYLDGEVSTYGDLPLDTAAAPLNSAWLVREASGLWLLARKPAGIYIRTATTGVRDDDYTYAGTFPDVFSDANFVVYNDTDSTKNLKLDTSAITTGTTRTLTVPNKSGTIATTDASDLASGTLADARLSANVALKDAANTFTQNQTFNGTNSTAPNQTAASGSSIMTRDLVDARLSALWVPIGGRPNNTVANGAYNAFVPWGTSAAGFCMMIPSSHTKLSAMYINIAFSSSPIAPDFSVTLLFGNSTGSNSVASANTQSLTGTVTNVSGNRYKWTLDALTTLAPSNSSDGAYYLAEIRFNNNSGGSLTTVAGDAQVQGYMLILP